MATFYRFCSYVRKIFTLITNSKTKITNITVILRFIFEMKFPPFRGLFLQKYFVNFHLMFFFADFRSLNLRYLQDR